jgi:hypothetical protein
VEEAFPNRLGGDIRLDRLDRHELLELAIGAPRKIDYACTSATENPFRLKDSKAGKLGGRL